ncbi:uncharacterized protein LOC144631705 isoform X1 [Oculina patagonica]
MSPWLIVFFGLVAVAQTMASGKKHCDSPLGIQNGDIPNSDITASSEWDANHGPSNARLNRPAGGGKTGAWSAKKNEKGQWIQVNLRQLTRVTEVAIQGRQDHAQWVTAFKLSYSLDGNNFQFQEKIYKGNNDQNSVVVNTLMEPIEARFIRLHPYAWYRHISLRMELYGCSLHSECATSLGIENYRIPNSAITASSEWDGNHGPTNARLNRPSSGGKTGAWSSKTNDVNQWIQVTFSEATKVTKVGIQGRYDYNQWVTKFKVSYSLDGVHFTTQSKVYNGNSNRNGIVINDLEAPIEARVVRINPVGWYGHISMRMELYGCRLPSECATPLGMENSVIPSYAISASSEWDGNHGASNARLHRVRAGWKTGAWSSKANDKSQWIQVDLRGMFKVTKIVTQGRQDYAQWVTQYKVSYSTDGVHFNFQNKVYQANSDQNSVVVNTLEAPIEARFVRLNPQQWHGHISLRMELYGCSVISDCASPMGMENKLLPNYAITASSKWDGNHGPTNARLYHMAGGGKTGAWSARTNDKSQWIQVDFGEVKRVTQVASQGRSDNAQWVTKYRVSYSTFGKEFKFQDHDYEANSDQHSVVVNTLIKPVEALFIRLNIQGWYGHISMRFELYGCNIDAVCVSPLGLTNKKLPNSAFTASSEWDGRHGASNARLHHVSGWGRTGAWSAKLNNKGQWIEVDLSETTKVTMVATQGRYDHDQWVKTYKVAYSKYGGHFVFQNKVYEANTDRNSVIVNDLIQPIEARFVRIYPETWYGHMSMRMELYGCNIYSDCMSPLGLEANGIPDSAITASSVWDSNHGPNNARIFHMAGGGRTGAWSAKTNDKGQWIQVNLGKSLEVTKIGLQGRQDYAQWLTEYRVSYSLDGQHFTVQNQKYSGNKDQSTLVITDLVQPVKAQFIRILPEEWHGHISMRMELYGCDSRAVNGGYSEWGDWNQCSFMCGGGSRSRSRSCNNPAPQYGGADCSSLGPSQETRSCNEDPCPEDGGYSNWNEWSTCTVSCGLGTRARSRKCDNPTPQYGGKDCSVLGPSFETDYCNSNDCPRDGGYSAWGPYGKCSKSCGGGKQTRERTCTNPPPSAGGNDCSGLGPSTSSRECNNQYCPKDGGYGPWGEWSECSKTCGKKKGTTTRVRLCNNPEPQNGGKDCSKLGEDSETKQCKSKKKKCPGSWQPLGCFFNNKESSLALPDSFGSEVGEKQGIKNKFEYCSAEAKKFKYKVFGVDDQNCWSGDDAENTYDKYGESSQCSVKKGKGIGKQINGDIFVYKSE